MLNDLKSVLSNLYAEYGLTDNILELSQIIDKLIVGDMNERLPK